MKSHRFATNMLVIAFAFFAGANVLFGGEYFETFEDEVVEEKTTAFTTSSGLKIDINNPSETGMYISNHSSSPFGGTNFFRMIMTASSGGPSHPQTILKDAAGTGAGYSLVSATAEGYTYLFMDFWLIVTPASGDRGYLLDARLVNNEGSWDEFDYFHTDGAGGLESDNANTTLSGAYTPDTFTRVQVLYILSNASSETKILNLATSDTSSIVGQNATTAALSKYTSELDSIDIKIRDQGTANAGDALGLDNVYIGASGIFGISETNLIVPAGVDKSLSFYTALPVSNAFLVAVSNTADGTFTYATNTNFTRSTGLQTAYFDVTNGDYILFVSNDAYPMWLQSAPIIRISEADTTAIASTEVFTDNRVRYTLTHNKVTNIRIEHVTNNVTNVVYNETFTDALATNYFETNLAATTSYTAYVRFVDTYGNTQTVTKTFESLPLNNYTHSYRALGETSIAFFIECSLYDHIHISNTTLGSEVAHFDFSGGGYIVLTNVSATNTGLTSGTSYTYTFHYLIHSASEYVQAPTPITIPTFSSTTASVTRTSEAVTTNAYSATFAHYTIVAVSCRD